jgi:hypothetical protein
MGRLLDAADERGRFAEIGLGMTRRVVQRHEHLPATPPMLPDVVLIPPSRSPASRRGSRPAALARFAGVMRRRGCRTVTIGGRSGAGPMQALLDYASYMPHGYCLFWQPWLVALHAGSDALIFIAYSATPHVISAPPGHPLPGPRCALRHLHLALRDSAVDRHPGTPIGAEAGPRSGNGSYSRHITLLIKDGVSIGSLSRVRRRADPQCAT